MSANGIQKVTSGCPLRILRNTAGSPYKKRRGSMNHSLEFDIGQSGVHSPHYNCTVRGSPGVYQDQDVSAFKNCRQTSGTGQSSVTSAISSHSHWCTNTLCEKRREIKTCDGYKRHEKEHDMLYTCMPYGSIETSAEGRGNCAFCGVQEPDQGHLLLHNVSLCIGKASGPLTKSRKADLLKHLALHGVSEEDSSTLTNKWCYKSTKKFFSCGFCIELFTTIADRLNHIDHEHYKNFQDIEAWDLSKVIKGLLLQPGVQTLWYNLLISHPLIPSSDFSWDRPIIHDLQRRLEMSEEPAETLAWDAFTQSTSYRRIYGTPSGSINMVDPTAAGLAISKEQHQVSRTPKLDCYQHSCLSSFMLLPIPT